MDKVMNYDLVRREMQRRNIDGLLATTGENVFYSSGLFAIPLWTRRTSQIFCFSTVDDLTNPIIINASGALDEVADQFDEIPNIRRFGPRMIQPPREAPLSAVESRLDRMLATDEYPDIVEATKQAIADSGCASSTIGVDEAGILPAILQRLKVEMPAAKFVDATDLFSRARSIKTPVEIERLRRSANIAEESIAAALDIAHVGVSEIDIANEFYRKTIVLGGFPVIGSIASGERSAMAFGQPTERKLRRGDLIRFDVGCRYLGYRSDIARIATVGEPTRRVATYHKALKTGVGLAIDMIRPGVKVADVFTAVVETVRREGIPHYVRNHVGHGIGIDGIDAPNITDTSDAVFEEGMVICVEAPYYELGLGGIQVEDTIVVRKDSAENLMKTSGDLRIV